MLINLGIPIRAIGMKNKFSFTLLLTFLASYLSSQNMYVKDFNEFWNDIHAHYAYLEQQHIDWEKVKSIYIPLAEKIERKNEFIHFLETVLNELYNGHSSLNTNLVSSNRLVPSGQDLYVEKVNGQFFITDVRAGSAAEKSGLQTGMEIISFNGQPVESQLNQFLPKFTKVHNEQMVQYALDMLFAGTHDVPREITANEDGKIHTYYPDQFEAEVSSSLLESKEINKHTAYIRIHNSLGDHQLISDFDSTLNLYLDKKNIVLDLTDTPGGGNTTVARAILGRFIQKILPYQKHEYDEFPYDTKRIWTEYVMPRKPQFRGKVYVLAGHWTGSMGEGMAIAFDGMKRGNTIGTRMAGLLGAISNFQLSETKIGYQFPTERLFHVNGTPRENFLPKILTRNTVETFERMGKIK